MMSVLITIVHVIVCFVLIIVILLQAGRGQGLAGPTFASGNVQSLFGTRAADFLTKATSVSAICFLFTCLALNIIEARKSRSLLEAARPTAPVDIEAIKKALEKVRKGEGTLPVAAPVQEQAGKAVAEKMVPAAAPKPPAPQEAQKPAAPSAASAPAASKPAARSAPESSSAAAPAGKTT